MLYHLYLNDSEITADSQTRQGRFIQYGFLLARDKKIHICSLSKALTSKSLHKPRPGQSVPYTRQTVGQLQPLSGALQDSTSFLADQSRDTLEVTTACCCLEHSLVGPLGGSWHQFFQNPYHKAANHNGVQTNCPCTWNEAIEKA